MDSGDRIWLKAKNAAALADMSVRKFFDLVAEGKLPGPVDIGGMNRWRRDGLIEAIEKLADADS